MKCGWGQILAVPILEGVDKQSRIRTENGFRYPKSSVMRTQVREKAFVVLKLS